MSSAPQPGGGRDPRERPGLLERLLTNHPLANICFAIVLLIGTVAYLTMPREQDPEINFNWVNIITALPGASAEDVERRVTDPLEDAIKGVADLRFVVSNSRENVSSILVRFREISPRTFDKRINDLRREIQNKASSELPEDATDPRVLEITTSNGFPTAILLLRGQADDEVLRRQARVIKSDLERLSGVDTVFASGLRDPEIRIRFDPVALAARGLRPTDVANSVSAWYRDMSAGTLKAGDTEWLIRLAGQQVNPEAIARIPIISAAGAGARVGDVAGVERVRADAAQQAFVDDKPAITFAVNKKSGTNTIDLVGRLASYIESQQPALDVQGLNLSIGDDQTVPTRRAISVMQTNALQGLALVVLVCWLFLGWRIALLVGIGIPFSLAGTFAILNALGMTLNVSVLLGTVIALGMLVDDAVVVVEAIYYRIERGMDSLEASLAGVREVASPVLSSVATTMAAFLPLMLMPGIVGKFMFLIPFVVSLALAISLAEAFWMLPTHVSVLNVRFNANSRGHRVRRAFNRGIRHFYARMLGRALRHPFVSAVLIVALLAGAGVAWANGWVRVQFFAFDALRIFYVNVDMPPGASIEQTSDEVRRLERALRKHLNVSEPRSLTAVAGLKFTETEPLYGDSYGQVIVSLMPRADGGREVGEIVDALRGPVAALGGVGRTSFLQLSGGPPLTKPISVKVRADDPRMLREAVDTLLDIVRSIDGTRDVVDDDVPGRPELSLKLNPDALRSSGLDAATVARVLRLAVAGEVVAELRDAGDRIELRVMAAEGQRDDIGGLLQFPIALPASVGGGTTTLGALTEVETRRSRGIVRHYNLRRTITVEAELDKTRLDTAVANEQIRLAWEKVQTRFPGADLEFGGELEDIEESLSAMAVLFPFGVGLIYLILAAQFRSYWQPLMILATIPLAFCGVTFGLLVTGNPLSLFTMYGVIALAGIAVNSAIVLIDAANQRLADGYALMHALVLAARRRVVPVLITSLTTVAGLFSLATGLGGRSLLWGPVASSIVWGLGISTLLTLFVIPLLYASFMRRAARRRFA